MKHGFPGRRFLIVMGAVSVSVVALAGSLLIRDGTQDDRQCETRAGAEVCLVTRGHAYRIEGTGFAPGDDVRVTFSGEEPLFLRADGEGRVPGRTGAVAGYLPGERPSLVTVMGNGASGEAVYVELTACGRSARGERLC